MQELGMGIVSWTAEERRSDRYGYVSLFPDLQAEESIKLAKIKEGRYGRLYAIVRETRKSTHIGDLFHAVYPQTPKVGERITLGEGMLSLPPDNTVGLIPRDNRPALWLDIKALYNVHQQTVTLYFEEANSN